MKPRPLLRYHGGKWRLAPWLLTLFPPHRCYTEAYGGGASLLLQKTRVYAEIYNDLDGEVVNVFRVVRDPVTAERLTELLRLTPFARDEFEEAYLPTADPVEQARRTIIKSFMGYGSSAIHTPRPRGMRTTRSTWRPPTGFRANVNRSGTTPAHDWANFPWHIPTFTERLAGVVIENRAALDILKTHDGEDTLHYVDPPYVLASRGDTRPDYRHEMTEADHRQLAELLHGLKGMVVISGYATPLYDDELYHHWGARISRGHYSDRARKRIEVVWMNPKAAEAHRAATAQGTFLGA